MDPITAGLLVCGKALDFGMKIYDDTPKEIRVQGAADWGAFVHNIAKQILNLQAKVMELGPK